MYYNGRYTIRKMKDKKGYLKVIEVLIAFVLTYWFITFVITANIHADDRDREHPYPLRKVPIDPLRGCILSDNVTCVDESISAYNPGFDNIYEHTTIIMNLTGSHEISLPDKKVFIDSRYIAGNVTVYEPKIVKIYIWKK